MLGDSAYDTRLARPPAGRRVVPAPPVQRTKHRRSERHRVQGRSPHRRTQRGRSAEAIDARRDVQPPDGVERTNDAVKDCGLARSRPRPRPRTSTSPTRCAVVSLLRSPTTNAETIQEAPSSRPRELFYDTLLFVSDHLRSLDEPSTLTESRLPSMEIVDQSAGRSIAILRSSSSLSNSH